jgi:hypothetical protein
VALLALLFVASLLHPLALNSLTIVCFSFLPLLCDSDALSISCPLHSDSMTFFVHAAPVSRLLHRFTDCCWYSTHAHPHMRMPPVCAPLHGARSPHPHSPRSVRRCLPVCSFRSRLVYSSYFIRQLTVDQRDIPSWLFLFCVIFATSSSFRIFSSVFTTSLIATPFGASANRARAPGPGQHRAGTALIARHPLGVL